VKEPATNPDGLDRLGVAMRRAALAIMLLLLVAASQCGCGGTSAITGVAGVVKTTLDVLRQTRSVICTPALDPLMGDPREGQPQWVVKDASPAADVDAAEGGAP
jgi:hypothetical protein